MNKKIDFTKFLSVFLFGFVILSILLACLIAKPYYFKPYFFIVNGSKYITLLISSLFFLLANTSISFKAKLFPSSAKFNKFLDSLLMIQMLFSLCSCLYTLRFSLINEAFTGASCMQNIAFSAFFVIIYLSNKTLINKAFIYVLGGVYIGFWYAYNFFADYISVDISDIISVIIIVFYMMIFGSFYIPPLKSFFYHTVIVESINEQETDMVCISVAVNEKGEIEMLMITDRQEYVIYNCSAKDKVLVDEDNLMSINEDLRKELGLFIISNK